MPRLYIRLFLWIVIASTARSQVPAQQVRPAENDDRAAYELRGSVVNSVTGKPVSRALVTISPQQEAVLTGAEGDFSFNAIRGGRISVLVTKPGFFRPGELPYQTRPRLVDLNAKTSDLVLKLLPEAVITGQVTGKDREPVERAVVSVFRKRSGQGHQSLAYAARGLTDQDGNFRIDGLPEGVYNLDIREVHLDGATQKTPAQAYPLLTYYPDASEIASATAIKLNAGEHRELSFSVKPVPTFKVAGRVAVEEGWTLENGPRLIDVTGNVLGVADRFDGKTGLFEFSKFPAGTYVVEVTGKNRQGEYSASRRKLTVDAKISDLQLSLSSGIEIPVVVQRNFPRLLGQCSSTTRTSTGENQVRQPDCSDYPEVRIELAPLDVAQSFSSGWGPRTANTELGVSGVSPGTYWVRATPMFGGYVKSLRSGGIDLLVDPLVVPESGQVPAIEVTLRNDVGKLLVHVRGALPAQQIEFVVIPDPITNVELINSRTGLGPDFQITALPPGAYKVFAFDPNDDVEYSNPDFLAIYNSQAGNVRVAADGNATATVDLIHSDK